MVLSRPVHRRRARRRDTGIVQPKVGRAGTHARDLFLATLILTTTFFFQEIAHPKAHEATVTDIQMSIDGTYFITSSKDKSAKVTLLPPPSSELRR
jgi:hypothetical protein